MDKLYRLLCEGGVVIDRGEVEVTDTLRKYLDGWRKTHADGEPSHYERLRRGEAVICHRDCDYTIFAQTEAQAEWMLAHAGPHFC